MANTCYHNLYKTPTLLYKYKARGERDNTAGAQLRTESSHKNFSDKYHYVNQLGLKISDKYRSVNQLGLKISLY